MDFFDGDLAVCRHRFEDAVLICDIETEEAPQWKSERPTVLGFSREDLDLTVLIDWLTAAATENSSLFYLHHHDNIVPELALSERYRRAAFIRRLRFFRTRPAAEGGANLLGVVDPRQVWMLVLDNDNQGRFRVDFFGPKPMCDRFRGLTRRENE